MDKTTIFKNAYEPWNKEEELLLNKLYNEDMLDIMEISKIHNRAPGGIISRLCKLNYITHRTLARGYINYKNSDLYKEIVSNNLYKNKSEIKNKPTKKINNPKIENLFISVSNVEYISLHNEVKEMKNEINYLKNNIKELIEMMKAVYEFENK